MREWLSVGLVARENCGEAFAVGSQVVVLDASLTPQARFAGDEGTALGKPGDGGAQTSAMDPVALAGAAAVLMLAAIAACWLPSRRAARVDLVRALRAEG